MTSSDDPASSRRVLDVALEIVAPNNKNDKNNNSGSNKPVVKKLAKSASSVRLIVQKLPNLVTAELANYVVSIILDEIERLPLPGRITKIQLAHVHFTDTGASILQQFFSSNCATTIRHVVLNNLISSEDDGDDKSSNDEVRKTKIQQQEQQSVVEDDNDYNEQENVENRKQLDGQSMESHDGNGDENERIEDMSLVDPETRRVAQIVSAFRNSPLTVLDFSRNRIQGSVLWKPFLQQHSPLQGEQQQNISNGRNGNHSTPMLKQLILDSVDMDQEAWITLSNTFHWPGLDDLHVVVDDTLPSDEAVDAAQQIVRQCTKLSSLRWIQKRGSERPLPWTGLRDMAVTRASIAAASNANSGVISSASSVSSNATGKHAGSGGLVSLKHLVLEGPGTPDFMTPRDVQDLTTTLKELGRLKTLKLRHLGMTDLSSICSALRSARPPLEVIDFSYNEISSMGCRRLGDLMRVSRISNQLVVLVLNDNRIETDAARDLLETFGTTVSLDNNPGVDFTRIVTDLLTVKTGLEQERDDLRLKLETRAYETGGENVEILKKENQRLREERDLLAKAFSVMGISQQVEEQRRLLERIQRLEDMVVLGAVIKEGGVAVRTSSGGGGSGNSGNGSVIGGLGSGHNDLSSGIGSVSGKTSSRRRINVNDLPLDRLTQAAAAAAASGGRNSSSRSLGRSHSNRSTASRTVGSDILDEVSLAVTESPHNYSNGSSRGSGGGGGASSVASATSLRGNSSSCRSYSRSMNPVSPGGSGRNGASSSASSLQAKIDRLNAANGSGNSVGGGGGNSSVMSGSMDSGVSASLSSADRIDRRTLSSSLRQSSYTSSGVLGGRRSSSRMNPADLEG